MGSSALTKIVRFDSKKFFLGSSALVRSSALAQKIVCFGSKDRLLSSSRSSAFSRIVCFRLYPLVVIIAQLFYKLIRISPMTAQEIIE